MSASLILHAREPLIGYTGEIVTEPDPDKPGTTRVITVGHFLANFVAKGTGEPQDKLVQCQLLALDLWREDEVALSSEDIPLILNALRKAHGQGQMAAWVVGHFQYLLDPNSVPEAQRERMERFYKGLKPIVTTAQA